MLGKPFKALEEVVRILFEHEPPKVLFVTQAWQCIDLRQTDRKIT